MQSNNNQNKIYYIDDISEDDIKIIIPVREEYKEIVKKLSLIGEGYDEFLDYNTIEVITSDRINHLVGQWPEYVRDMLNADINEATYNFMHQYNTKQIREQLRLAILIKMKQFKYYAINS